MRGYKVEGIVFGLNDGLVKTLVFIMAVSGVAPNYLVAIMLGEVLAGGVSMALGGYLSARTEQEILEHRIAAERYEIEHEPEQAGSSLPYRSNMRLFTDALRFRCAFFQFPSKRSAEFEV